MVNIPPVPAKTEVRTALIPDVTKTWKVGQVLNATAERNAKANDSVLMRMGQNLLEARTPVALKAGDPLKLLVKSLGDTPVLTIQAGTRSTNVAAHNLKAYIARQQDLREFLKVSQSLVGDPSMPKKLRSQLAEFNRQLPEALQLTDTKVLKKLIQNSGVFLESRLGGQTSESLGQDMKSQLLRISAQLQEVAPGLSARPQAAPGTNIQSAVQAFLQGDIDLEQLAVQLTNQLPRDQRQLLQQALSTADVAALPRKLPEGVILLLTHLLTQANPRQVLEGLSRLLESMGLLQDLRAAADGALAKITSQQLTPLTRDSDILLLLFDLYFKDKGDYHLINFRMEQEKPAGEGGAPGWMVTLNFDFRELGLFQAQLHLQDRSIHTSFCAERQSTADLLSRRIDLLETALEKIGFDAINLAVAQGSISQPNDLADDVQLLDEKA